MERQVLHGGTASSSDGFSDQEANTRPKQEEA
jgi:hypothetical protein